MEDIYVKCCRCKNKHLYSQRKYSAPDKFGMRHLTCPRCGGQAFHAEKTAQPTKGRD